MLSKEDYQQYLSQMLDLEVSMAGLYKKIQAKVQDKEIKKRIYLIMQDEIEHAGLVREMKELLRS